MLGARIWYNERMTIPLSLYLHFPWCTSKCPYCDFNSHAMTGSDLPERAYIKALINDLQRDLPYVQGRELVSIFMGGGTPSLFSGEMIATLLNAIKKEVAFAKNIEITLEANPESLTYEKIACLSRRRGEPYFYWRAKFSNR